MQFDDEESDSGVYYHAKTLPKKNNIDSEMMVAEKKQKLQRMKTVDLGVNKGALKSIKSMPHKKLGDLIEKDPKNVNLNVLKPLEFRGESARISTGEEEEKEQKEKSKGDIFEGGGQEELSDERSSNSSMKTTKIAL